jgi:polyhydroxyalkanoate synthesis regulator phasin
MKLFHRKLALALAAGVGSLGLFGAAALGAFGPDVSTAAGSAIEAGASALAGEQRPDKLKSILDGLVQKGVITAQQADAILAAVKDAEGARTKREPVLRDFLETAAQYLGLSARELHAKLPGTSLGAIANATAGKSRDGLVAALSAEANADIARALANKRITEEQATRLRAELPRRVNEFVDRTWPAARPKSVDRGMDLKRFLGDMLATGRDYLGLTPEQVTTQLRAGKSLGEIAATTPGKSRDGLIAALSAAASTRIDQAVAETRLTADQATALKEKIAKEIAGFVDRKPALKTRATDGTIRKP